MYMFISRVLLLILGFTTVHCSKITFKVKESGAKTPVIIPPPGIIQNKKLDLLIVIDNSSSMLPEHPQMAEKLKGILNKLKSVDYRVAVTTTDARAHFASGLFSPRTPMPLGFGGKALNFNGQTFISASTVDAEKILLASLDRSLEAACGTADDSADYWENPILAPEVCSSSEEEPTKVIYQFLRQKNTVNLGFLRPDASFVALIITDEDIDAVSGKSIDVSLDLNSIKLLRPEFKAYGVIAEASDVYRCQANWSGEVSIEVQKFITLSGGSHISICDDSYTSILDSIVSNL